MPHLPILSTQDSIRSHIELNREFNLDESVDTLMLSGLDIGTNASREVIWLQKFTQIRSLHLSNCHLEKIPAFVFKMTELVFLDLSLNEIVTVPQKIFKLTKLETLFLQDNLITKIINPANKLDKQKLALSNLRVIDLAANLFTKVPSFLSFLPKLQSVDLSHNVIKSVENTFISPVFTELVLSYNLIHQFYFSSPSVETIILEHNRMSDFPLFPTSLVHLNLNFNSLYMIPKTICRLTELEVLLLENNRIQKIPICMGRMSTLDEVSFDFNELDSKSMKLLTLMGFEVLSQKREMPLR